MQKRLAGAMVHVSIPGGRLFAVVHREHSRVVAVKHHCHFLSLRPAHTHFVALESLLQNLVNGLLPNPFLPNPTFSVLLFSLYLV